jgi:uncharacterized LabA/DUF88 family protein
MPIGGVGGAVQRPMPQFRRMMVFIDGENIVLSYQRMLDKGRLALGSVKHELDVYVWEERSIIGIGLHDIIRASYYTYATGTEDKVDEIRKEINALSYKKHSDSPLPNNLYSVVFKKAKKEAQSKGVDIQMTVDILSQVYFNNIDTVYLIAGDGDYLPIILEITKMGKQVYLSAFSEGLNPKLEHKVDQFHLLDDIYFQMNKGSER